MTTALLGPTERQLLSDTDLQALRKFAALLGDGTSLEVRRSDHSSTVPAHTTRVLERLLNRLAEGRPVTIGSLPAQITPNTAAELLNVSRPTVMKMIRQGDLSSSMTGSHHRLKSDDVLALRRKRRAERREAALELMELGDELDLP
ncbi:excisionase family DNA-binding protein [Zhihengliuella salsuginis]|uniref:Helix-turn-helix domain-containing protein n=1 Tax=Zhihengliuella salsuginis TaxID=578222 RepID=A0ABQ3GHR3_9MICC|nr:excisionase family DNA-binding protein [Zhihengliuella salsuginis]GHD07553.1 hypothetical protein GCM10008096_18420 [Zhihengliuella salsuginis]